MKAMRRLAALAAALLILPALALADAIWVSPEGTVDEFAAFSGIAGRRAYVLCDKLTVRSEPGWQADAVTRLRNGNTFITWESQGGWINCYYSDGAEIGWVRSEYVLVDPGFVQTVSSTPAYAYSDAGSPRVGLIGTGETLPVIAQTGAGCWVSLRGGSAFIRDVSYPQPVSTLDIVSAELVTISAERMSELGKPAVSYALLTDRAKLSELSAMLSGAEQLSYASKCPFGVATLNVTCADGSVYSLDLAVDSCTIYILDGAYYNYMPAQYRNQSERPDNSILFDLFVSEGDANG